MAAAAHPAPGYNQGLIIHQNSRSATYVEVPSRAPRCRSAARRCMTPPAVPSRDRGRSSSCCEGRSRRSLWAPRSTVPRRSFPRGLARGPKSATRLPTLAMMISWPAAGGRRPVATAGVGGRMNIDRPHPTSCAGPNLVRYLATVHMGNALRGQLSDRCAQAGYFASNLAHRIRCRATRGRR